MSTTLTGPVTSIFEKASVREIFFDKDDDLKLGQLDQRERPPVSNPNQSCNTNLFFGFFFDGTRNNYAKAEASKSHSNVARLYDCFPGQSVHGVLPKSTDWKYHPTRYNHFFRVYIPGVASPFKEVGDSGEGMIKTLGGAMGAGGEARIVWALLQAINNVHRYFFNDPLLSTTEAMTIAKTVTLTRMARQFMTRNDPSGDNRIDLSFERPRITFEKILKRLHASVSQHWTRHGEKPAKIDPGIVGTIFISTFGFSRGATQARAFANWLDSLCRLDAAMRGEGTRSLGGFPVEFDFLGLFDSVASIGPGATTADSPILPTTHGHSAWADAEDSLRIPACINKCVHLVSGHELRRSFPLDSIAVEFTLPERSQEMVFPGVHSDLGGGYAPMEHGKGTDEHGADMLSRLPLLTMYRQARLAGVPLKLELADEVVQARFATTPRVIKDFNAYLAACTKTSGRITDIIREQAVLQMAWRYARRRSGPAPIHQAKNFLRASDFDKNDLESANKDFDDELRDFEQSVTDRGNRRPQAQKPGFDENYDNELEEIALNWPLPKLGADIMHFFDEYVHDSRAGFKLSGHDNEPDALAAVRRWSQHLDAAKQRHGIGLEGSNLDTPPDYGMNTNERIAAEEYDRTGKLPRYYTTGRESYSSFKSGYLRFRRIYGGSDRVLLSHWWPGTVDGTLGTRVAQQAKAPATQAHTSA